MLFERQFALFQIYSLHYWLLPKLLRSLHYRESHRSEAWPSPTTIRSQLLLPSMQLLYHVLLLFFCSIPQGLSFQPPLALFSLRFLQPQSAVTNSSFAEYYTFIEAFCSFCAAHLVQSFYSLNLQPFCLVFIMCPSSLSLLFQELTPTQH